MALLHISEHIAAALIKIEPLKATCRECRNSFIGQHPDQSFCKSCLGVLGKVAMERHAELQRLL